MQDAISSNTLTRTKRSASPVAAQGKPSAELPLQECPCHHDALDLVCSLIYLGDLGVAHHPLDREVLDVPRASEELDRIGRDLHGHVRGEALGRRAEEAQIGIAALGLGRRNVDHPVSYTHL